MPVVVQDPIWEQSFPPVGSVTVPLADADGRRVRLVRLSRTKAAARREANEARLAAILHEFATHGFDAVLIGSVDREDIFRAFLTWAEERVYVRRMGW